MSAMAVALLQQLRQAMMLFVRDQACPGGLHERCCSLPEAWC
jgi:hypothetical protein